MVKRQGSCVTCRLRKKRCVEPDGSNGNLDCAKCQELNLECLRGYDLPVPRKFKDKVQAAKMTARIKQWTRKRSNRTISQERLALSDSPLSSPLLSRNRQTGAGGPRVTMPTMPTLQIPLSVPCDEDSAKANLVGGLSAESSFPRDVRVPESDTNGELSIPSILASPPLSVDIPPAAFPSCVHTLVDLTATSGDRFSYDETQYGYSQPRQNVERPDAEATRPRIESDFVAERHSFHQHPRDALEAHFQRNFHQFHRAAPSHQLTAMEYHPLPGPSHATVGSLTHEAYSAGPSCFNEAMSPIRYSSQFQHTLSSPLPVDSSNSQNSFGGPPSPVVFEDLPGMFSSYASWTGFPFDRE